MGNKPTSKSAGKERPKAFVNKYRDWLKIRENAKIIDLPRDTLIKEIDSSEKSGTKEIGYGHAITATEKAKGEIYGIPYKDGIMVGQAERILEKDIEVHKVRARKKLGTKFDKLPEPLQVLLSDYEYTGVLLDYTKFTKAIYSGDYTKAVKESKRNYTNRKTGAFGPMKDRNKSTLIMLKELKDLGYLT